MRSPPVNKTEAKLRFLRLPREESEAFDHGIPLAGPLESGIDLHRKLLSVTDALLVGRISAELQGRREAVALDGAASEEGRDFDGALEKFPGPPALLPVQADRTGQDGTEIDDPESLAVAKEFQLVPLRVHGEQVVPPHAFKLDIFKSEGLHVPERPDHVVERGRVAVLRDRVEPAATDLHAHLLGAAGRLSVEPARTMKS